MELNEITERLIKARKNRDALDQQYKKAVADVERLNTLRIKWAGISDYFQSLLPTEDKSKAGPVPYTVLGMGVHKQN